MAGRLTRTFWVTATSATVLLSVLLAGQGASPVSGTWTLDRSLSEMPREMGFRLNWRPATDGGSPSSGSSGGGRGRRGSGAGGRVAFPIASESSEDARRLQILTAEARNPPARLIIVDTPAAITMTNELGQS